MCFFFNKIGEQEDGTGSSRRWEEVGGGVPNNVHVSKYKNDKIKFKHNMASQLM
jgi:hypothetical protein